ncbi:hypothetical protein LCGC14_0018280 [marine sediment metagenome]|uniref:ABC transporter domain-containing protein n=1 Tax=marine sediment metagenome TaxID=412755 RepID=A0A0F9YGJ6_9ZZZZ|nr:ABC transporter ATP-binding protein [Phycisphaerae bacterium]HDZ44959.1 ABC transporter ATP-binding protein [Phycisphaerae bacterium]
MTDNIAISVRDVSKKYRLFATPRHRLLEALHPFRKQYHKEFWALRNITFDLAKGRTLGIVGRNGSGKSSLLQILCAVLRPSMGEVTTEGRISALLELGAAFNPQFTGRDNVIFQGQLMGISNREMDSRMAQVEAFADIGEFIDQPVKTYSSGMFVRLAFAAAINVDPDILIVDEALAVGDAKFQRKCFQKFTDFQKAGKTIVLVTHSTELVTRHCDVALLLQEGAALAYGDPNDVCNQYNELLFGQALNGAEADTSGPARTSLTSPEPEMDNELDRFLKTTPEKDRCPTRRTYNRTERRFGSARARIIDYLVVRGGDFDPVIVRSGDTVDIYVKACYEKEVAAPTFGINVKTVDGVVVYGNSSVVSNLPIPPATAGEIRVFKFTLKLSLHSGHWFLGLGIGDRTTGETEMLDGRYDLIHFIVDEDAPFDGLADLQMSLSVVSRMSVPG